MRTLDLEAARAAALGGLVYGAGGGGLERGLRAAEAAFSLGRPVLATLDELDDEDRIAIVTGVGAPGRGARTVWPRDTLRALDLLRAAYQGPGRIVGIMTAHPGAFMPGTWLPAALDPGLLVVDCAANGRGHPTVSMGGMGLAGRPEARILQAGAGGLPEDGTYLEVVARGSMAAISSLMHHASSAAGGGLAACRGPFSVAFCRGAGAPGAVSRSILLGEAMLAAREAGAEALIEAIAATSGGHVLGRGPVTGAGLAVRGNWEVGSITVQVAAGTLALSVCNEYMAADLEGRRVASFPDLIVTLSPADGMPTAASQLRAGEEAVVLAVPRDRLALGAGVWDRAVYGEVEALLGIDLASYALAGAPPEGAP